MLLLLCLIAWLPCWSAFGQEGSPDPTSGDEDITINFDGPRPRGAYYQAAAVESDGKVVAAFPTAHAGDYVFVVLRYNADGTPDASFGTDGKATVDFGRGRAEASAVALSSDGKIIVAGSSNQSETGADFALARLNSDGSLDSSFGAGGKVTVDFGGTRDGAIGVALGPEGKILIAGSSDQSGTGYDLALARLNSNGTLDTGFGTDGKRTIDFGGTRDLGGGVEIGSDGKILVSVRSGQSNMEEDFVLVRLNSDGTLDSGFGSGGKVTTRPGGTTSTDD